MTKIDYYAEVLEDVDDYIKKGDYLCISGFKNRDLIVRYHKILKNRFGKIDEDSSLSIDLYGNVKVKIYQYTTTIREL